MLRRENVLGVILVLSLLSAFVVPSTAEAAPVMQSQCVRGAYYQWFPDSTEWDGGHWAVVFNTGNPGRFYHSVGLVQARLWNNGGADGNGRAHGGVWPTERWLNPVWIYIVCPN